jgi:hypothetical protein
MTENNILPITVVENGYNTSYITSLLVGLFYAPTNYYDLLLDSMPSDIKIVYLQELIKNNLVEPLRKNIVINNSIINEIKNILLLFDFINKEQFIKSQNILNLYNIINSNSICTEYITNNQIINIPFINLTISNNEKETNLSTLVKKWLYDNIIVPHLSQHIELKKIPSILPIYINKKNDEDIDIKYQIKPFYNIDKFSNVTMSIHSIICYSKLDNHYYTIFLDKKEWILFSDKLVPSFIKIDIKNNHKIRKEVVLVIYKYEDLYI